MSLQPVQVNPVSNFNDAKLSFQLEGLIKKIINKWQTKQFYRGAVPYEKKLITLVYRDLQKNLDAYLGLARIGITYTEYLDAFWYGCQLLRWLDIRMNRAPQVIHLDKQIVSYFIECVLSYSRKRGFKLKMASRKFQLKEKVDRLTEHMTTMLNAYAKVLVVRVDLAYLKKANVTVNQVFYHMERFTDLFQNRKQYSNLSGYAMAIEQSKRTGFHIHAVFYFPGYMHRSDWYWANEFGALWLHVTGGIGRFHNCNDPKYLATFEQRGLKGVGMIHRNNHTEMENAIRTISYLVSPDKENQHLRMWLRGHRSITYSEIY